MKLGEDATPKLTAATIEKAEITAFRQRDLLIECRDVLERTHVHYCGKRFSFDTGDHCCEIGALLAKLEA